MTHAWIDASAGVAGDMLLGALLDAGADLAAVRAGVEAVIAGAVAIDTEEVTRAGLRATKAHVRQLIDDPPHRSWSAIRSMIEGSDLARPVSTRALATFEVLARAEARVHGIATDAVHFHEVGALDSIADVVGVAAALADLGIDTISAGEIALGSGTARTAHGALPVPVPAVLELARGWPVTAGGEGELTTPTGMALLAALAARSEALPRLRVDSIGVGAGSRDRPGRANVTRVVVGAPVAGSGVVGEALLLEANLDDLDPRLWPGVLSRLLATGADDAWLSPILMKKGRPAHTLHVLCAPERATELRTVILAVTSTIGVRQSAWQKYALPRLWREVPLLDGTVPIKLAVLDGRIVQVSAEFDAVATLAATTGRPEADVLAATLAAAAAAGLVVGSELPEGRAP